LHFADLQSESSGSVERAKFALKKMVEEYREIDSSLIVHEDESLRLLHLSDLHFDGVDVQRNALQTNRIVERLGQLCGGKPISFIAISGDITEHGLPVEFEVAEEWLSGFAERLGISLPSARILVVPGNHDICLPLAASSNIQFEKGQFSLLDVPIEHQTFLASFGVRPFVDFFSRVCSMSLLPLSDKDALPWLQTQFLHLGLVFYGVNTARPIIGCSLPGRVSSEDALSEIEGKLSAVLGEKRPLVIGMGHHSPISRSGDEGVSNPDVFARFFRSDRASTSVFLHGHSHSRGVYYTEEERPMVVCAAPTLNKGRSGRPEDTLRGFNFLEIKRKGGDVIGIDSVECQFEQNDLRQNERKSFIRGNTGHLGPRQRK
jgi:3',5'-cyclic AMP phosphodiesterase CpdA